MGVLGFFAPHPVRTLWCFICACAATTVPPVPQDPVHAGREARLKGLGICLLYAFTSTTISMVNKVGTPCAVVLTCRHYLVPKHPFLHLESADTGAGDLVRKGTRVQCLCYTVIESYESLPPFNTAVDPQRVQVRRNIPLACSPAVWCLVDHVGVQGADALTSGCSRAGVEGFRAEDLTSVGRYAFPNAVIRYCGLWASRGYLTYLT